MFTGIVAASAPVLEATMTGGVMRLVVECPMGFTKGLVRGASVSINGVCLTVVQWDDTRMHFDVIDESLARSNLGEVQVGTLVNLERAARFGDEIGGHPLSGHIHTEATITEILRDGDNVSMALEIGTQWTEYVISKGYIAINGCSLTIGDVHGQVFWLHLIPETLQVTNLGTSKVGDALNVEIDHQTQVIVETVSRYMASREI